MVVSLAVHPVYLSATLLLKQLPVVRSV
jgi:hypothetical protein